MANVVCDCTQGDIEQFCGGVNAPNLDRQLAITCQDELLAIPAPTTGTHAITTAITYRSAVTGPPAITAGKFHTWNFSKEDCSYESERDENGMWKSVVKIFIQKMEAQKTYTLNGLTGENQIAIVFDKNGKKRLIGALNNGCKVMVKETTSPKNGYEVQILWESAYAPYFYESTITY